MKKRHVEKEKEEVVIEEGLELGVSAGYHRKQPGLKSRRKEQQAMQERPPIRTRILERRIIQHRIRYCNQPNLLLRIRSAAH
jgi:hypothetical protein